MTKRETYDLVAKAVENNDLEGSMDLYAENAVMTGPEGRFEGKAAIRQPLADLLAGFSSIAFVTTNFIDAPGDTYVAEWTCRASHTGTLKMADGTEVPATGKSVEIRGCEVGRVVGGLIEELNLYYDLMAMGAQLGLLPG